MSTSIIGRCEVCLSGPVRLHRLPASWLTISEAEKDDPQNHWCAECIAEGEPPTDEQYAASMGPLEALLVEVLAEVLPE